MDKYIKPKVGDIVICIDDDSEDVDFGFSGHVLKGTRGLVVGREYEILSIDTSQVPKQGNTWTDEQYLNIQWYWTRCWIRGEGFSGSMLLGYFKRKEK
jgi:hypothetical protein